MGVVRRGAPSLQQDHGQHRPPRHCPLQNQGDTFTSVHDRKRPRPQVRSIHLLPGAAPSSHGFRSALNAITSWLDDPAWMRVSSTVLIHVQSYETSEVGVYGNECGCGNIAEGGDRFFHCRLQLSITTASLGDTGHRLW